MRDRGVPRLDAARGPSRARDRRACDSPPAPGPLTSDVARRVRERHRGGRGLRVKVVTVIGNRPQFVKAAAVSRRCASATRSCSSTPASTTTTSCRPSSSTSSGMPAPRARARASAAARTPSRRRACSRRSSRCSRRSALTRCSSTATRTRRSPVALAAAQRHVPVAHVEAGMRSFDRRDARGAQPRAHRPPRRPCCCARPPAAVAQPRARAVGGRVELVGDVMVDVARAAAPARARRGRAAARGAASSPAATCSRPRTAPATSTTRRGWPTSSACCARGRPARRAAAAPADARAPGGGRACSTPSWRAAACASCRRWATWPSRRC